MDGRADAFSERFVLVTGCSGGGKSTLIDALAARGFGTVPEPGRRIVAEELKTEGRALPWVDMQAFAQRAVDVARDDLRAAQSTQGPVFFDRGLIDAAVALQFSGGPSVKEVLGEMRPYAQRVFVAPPWPEIYKSDDERRHTFEAAEEEYQRIAKILPMLGYEIFTLPKISVPDRAEMVITNLATP